MLAKKSFVPDTDGSCGVPWRPVGGFRTFQDLGCLWGMTNGNKENMQMSSNIDETIFYMNSIICNEVDTTI